MNEVDTPPLVGRDGTSWFPWVVSPASGFRVRDDANGQIGFVQIDEKQFLLTRPFRFSDSEVEDRLIKCLVDAGKNAVDARRDVDDARTFNPSAENPTDLASIPRYMRWFESSYGVHTLAAVIHDELIGKKPNSGALGSDTLSDRFFREMMRSAGVPWLKRWIMWASVALRARWAARGVRRWSVVVWLLLASVGLIAFGLAAGPALFGWNRVAGPWLLLAIAVFLPLPAAFLWGRQFGAGLIGAAVAFWVLPAAIFAGVGYLTYVVLESTARRFGLTR
jgi:Protein of unknown function (DUF1353)